MKLPVTIIVPLLAVAALVLTPGSVSVAHGTSASQAVNFLNAQRVEHGFPPVSHNPKLSEGCKAHNRYMKRNGFDHGETPGKPGYSLAGAGEGEFSYSAEVLSYGGYPPSGSNPWENAPIHLYLMLLPANNLAGYDDSEFSCMRMGRTSAGNDGPLEFYSYPSDGTTNVRFRQHASELPYIPQELVGIPESQPTGPNILLFSSDRRSELQASSWSLTGPDGAVATELVQESTRNRVGDGSWFAGGGVMIPVRPLSPSTAYTARINWVDRSGDEHLQVLSFTTRPGPPPPKRVVRPRIRFKAVKRSKRALILKVRFSRFIRGQTAKLAVTMGPIKCDALGSCHFTRGRTLQRRKVTLSRKLRVRVPIRRWQLVHSYARIALPGLETETVIQKPARAGWRFRGTPPGWTWYR